MYILLFAVKIYTFFISNIDDLKNAGKKTYICYMIFLIKSKTMKPSKESVSH